jgi:hypothetical protein
MTGFASKDILISNYLLNVGTGHVFLSLTAYVSYIDEYHYNISPLFISESFKLWVNFVKCVAGLC